VRLSPLFAALAVILGLNAATGPAARAGEEIRFATQPIPQYAPIFVAKQKHWLEEELNKVKPGIELKWASFPAGPPINESFAAGQQDFGFLGDTPALIGKAVGIDTRLAALSASSPTSLAVVVGAQSPIRSARELKGKRVAVTKGSYAQHLLALVLESGGLTFADVELVNLPNAEIAPAIVSGAIDAGAVWEPVISRGEAQNTIRVLADGSGIKKGILVIIVAQDFLKTRRAEAEAVLRAYARAAAFIKTNPREAAELLTEDTRLPADLLVKLLPKLDFNPAIGDEDLADLKKSEAYYRSIGLIKAPVDIDAWAVRDLVPAGAAR
jgi:sulfonate transport system substrate-binding protein